MQGGGPARADDFTVVLNDILVEVYNNIIKLEEQTLKNNGRLNLSINEMHLLEIVGKYSDTGITISELAQGLGVKRPSVTVAVNKLEKKGYVRKSDCQSDGRVVRVFLTKDGRKVDAYHQYYHRNMVREISSDFTDEEKAHLIKAIKKLNDYFKKSISE